jgi:putative ABC transport system permease protein
MNFFSTIKLVIRTLLARKGRSFLTILGIVIGVAGFIVIIALGAGAQSLVLGQITKFGSNLLSVQPGKSNEKGPPAQIFGVVVTTLNGQDEAAIRDTSRVPHATAVASLERGRGTITWQNKSVDTNFVGTEYTYPNVVSIAMQEGEFMNQAEDQANANVVVLGSTVANELFQDTNTDPVGQVIKIQSGSNPKAGGIPLRVVGVITPRGSAFFQDQDDQIFLPVGIAQQQLLGVHYLQAITVKVDSAGNVQETINDINAVMYQQHHIKTDADVDYTIRNTADAIAILTTVTSALSLFLTAMAAIALLVGGIGILNIMLVNVAERTREIGLRKAVGASNAAVRNQFLLEAGTLTSLGGAIGIVVGIITAYLVSLLMHALGYDWAFVSSLSSIVLSVGVSILTGVIFGSYPAYKAAKLNPIEALRYE